MEFVEKGICAAKGFRAAGVHAGFRKNKRRRDLAIIFSDEMCSAAAVYTQNKVKSASILVDREHLQDGKARAVICNSGNANTCSPNSMEIARGTCKLAADALQISEKDVIVCSTGVIGEPMVLEPFEIGIQKAVKKLSYIGSNAAAHAIMTTDKATKEVAVSFELGGKICHLGGIAKGSGMINPQMATMLCFLTTDVSISSSLLQKALDEDVPETFNQISIDGDTSTNDTVVLLANGMAGNEPIESENHEYQIFSQALRTVNSAICQVIAADGEGATKQIMCRVEGAPDKATARVISKTVIMSDLVKTAVFGEDANWGRVICAIGYAEGDFSVDNIDICLTAGDEAVEVCRRSVACDFDEELAGRILAQKKIVIAVDLNIGTESAIAYGCDMTYDYVRINGRYRT